MNAAKRPSSIQPLALLILLLVSTACPPKGSDQQQADTGSAVRPPHAADPNADIKFDRNAAIDPARNPTKPAHPAAEVSVRRIVVAFGPKRDKAAARQRAELLLDAARRTGADIATLQASYSDLPAKIQNVSALSSEGAYSELAFSMEVGQVGGPVEIAVPPSVGRGAFAVVARVEPAEISTAHVLIIYQGSKLAPPALKRSKEEAEKLAQRVLKKALLPTTNFAVLAEINSDSPSKLRGGVISPLIEGKLIAGFEPYFAAAKATEVGKVHPKLVETPYGFHVIKRLPLEKVLVSHILISYTGARNPPKEKRNKIQARRLVLKVQQELKSKPFEELAKQYSDDGSAANGGVLPPFARGKMFPRFEQFAFALPIGQVSDIVETPFGYHLIKRLR